MLEHIIFTAGLILMGVVVIGLALLPLSLVVGGWAHLSGKANQRRAEQLQQLLDEH